MTIKSMLTAKAEANPDTTAFFTAVVLMILTVTTILGWLLVFYHTEGFGVNEWVTTQAPVIVWVLYVIGVIAIIPVGIAFLGYTVAERMDKWIYLTEAKASRRRTVRFVKTNSPRRVEQRDFGNRFQCPKCGEIPITGPCPWGCDD